MKILLLEDDQTLSETIQHLLIQEGYEVDTALSMEEAENLSYHNTYDLYLFDINLPDGDGITFLDALRSAEDNTPTIFITALTDIASIAKSFELGAIDYIKKPFDPTELLIRIDAKFSQKSMTYGTVSYDAHSKITRIDGSIVDLSNVQTKIFEKLLIQKGNIVTKEMLYECLDHPSDTALRVALTKIKQKLGIDIKNIRGRGYLLEKL